MKKTLLCTATLATALLAAACGSDSGTSTSAADAVVVSEAWVKASDSGMTGAFAEIENTGSEDAHIVAVTSPASNVTELHEMVAVDGASSPKMQEMDGGLVIPAGTVHLLAPGNDHIMLMDLVEPVRPGSEVTFVLEFSDGSTEEFTAQVRDFAGAKEEYLPSGDMDGTPSGDMDGTPSGDMDGMNGAGEVHGG